MSSVSRVAALASLISAEAAPRTRESLAADLRRLGVQPGETLLVHSSLTSLGWVVGGQVAVVQALLDVLGPDGTLVVPTQTGDNSDPSDWSNPPVPQAWWAVIRDHTPAFDPALTPSQAMGVVAEAVRTWPGACRSDHPVTSFAAVGPRAAEITAVHDLDCQFGERSPLRVLAEGRARGLLLGVGWDSCTTFHLAEYRVPGLPRTTHGASVRASDGAGTTTRRWVTFEDLDADSDDFLALGSDFEAAGGAGRPTVRVGDVGSATARLFGLAEAVRFAEGWLPGHRAAPSAGTGS